MPIYYNGAFQLTYSITQSMLCADSYECVFVGWIFVNLKDLYNVYCLDFKHFGWHTYAHMYTHT